MESISGKCVTTSCMENKLKCNGNYIKTWHNVMEFVLECNVTNYILISLNGNFLIMKGYRKYVVLEIIIENAL